jgi:hypothetical protein
VHSFNQVFVLNIYTKQVVHDFFSKLLNGFRANLVLQVTAVKHVVRIHFDPSQFSTTCTLLRREVEHAPAKVTGK